MLFGKVLFHSVNGDTLQRYKNIQIRLWFVYFVIIIVLAIKYKQPFGWIFFATEYFVESNKFELGGSQVFVLVLLLHVLLPHIWYILAFELFLLKDTTLLFCVFVAMMLYLFVYELYLTLPFIACCMGAPKTVALRLIFCVYYTNLLVQGET